MGRLQGHGGLRESGLFSRISAAQNVSTAHADSGTGSMQTHEFSGKSERSMASRDQGTPEQISTSTKPSVTTIPSAKRFAFNLSILCCPHVRQAVGQPQSRCLSAASLL